ncbi:MAG TPA: M48 family metallopeptidase [Candidatus Methylomirabilis sp.]|nr:M48 family metallopeptidase [Candidatus Methylomirabilis sp.]
MQTDWEGHYLDGKTAARQRASVRLMRNGLQITTEGRATLWWPIGEIRQTQGFYPGEEVRLERGGEFPEVLLIPSPAFLANLHRVVPEMAARFRAPARRWARIRITVFAALGVVGLTAALYLWGIPAMASLVALRVPPSWEERLGRSVVEHLAPRERRCADPARDPAIREIVATLLAPLPPSPYRFQVLVVDNRAVNAFAAPGGHVVLFRGLLERTRSAEELAGVLAHEMQHILLRHPTRALLQHASSGLLLAALTGDASGIMAFGMESARFLGELRYSRQNEEEADADGMRMLLAAGVDPAGMIAFFEVLQGEGKKGLTPPTYLSTHPSTEARITRLRSLAAEPQGPSLKLLQGQDWADVRRICRAAKSIR